MKGVDGSRKGPDIDRRMGDGFNRIDHLRARIGKRASKIGSIYGLCALTLGTELRGAGQHAHSDCIRAVHFGQAIAVVFFFMRVVHVPRETKVSEVEVTAGVTVAGHVEETVLELDISVDDVHILMEVAQSRCKLETVMLTARSRNSLTVLLDEVEKRSSRGKLHNRVTRKRCIDHGYERKNVAMTKDTPEVNLLIKASEVVFGRLSSHDLDGVLLLNPSFDSDSFIDARESAKRNLLSQDVVANLKTFRIDAWFLFRTRINVGQENARRAYPAGG